MNDLINPCRCPQDNEPDEPKDSAIGGLRYIADSPAHEHGGFHPNTVQIAKDALTLIASLREALLLYHEAWNGSEDDWRTEMRKASQNADKVLSYD